MNKSLLNIILYVVIVLASIFIVYKRYTILQEPPEQTTMNYTLLVVFILFTYINLRRLIKLIKEYKK